MQKMRITIGVIGLLLISGASSYAQETILESRIVSLGLFKNGLAFVTREVDIPDSGTYRIDNVPEPVHGSFWIDGEAEVKAHSVMRQEAMPIEVADNFIFQDAWAGKKVNIYFRDQNRPSLSGEVVKLEEAREPNWDEKLSYPNNSYVYDSYQFRRKGRFLILKVSDGYAYIDLMNIDHIQVQSQDNVILKHIPVLLLNVNAKKHPTTIRLSYLAQGISWVPGYRINLINDQQLTIEQNATIKNEFAPITQADIFLISGFPNTPFGNVLSPFSLHTDWATFFQQLKKNSEAEDARLAQAQYLQARRMPSPYDTDNFSASSFDDGTDMHYQPIGKWSLDKEESMLIQVASETADYEKIVEWIIPDTRDAEGRYAFELRQKEDQEKYQDIVWDSLRFKNPLNFPMSSGSVIFTTGNQFLGQAINDWVDAGEETILHITKALNVHTNNIEYENQINLSQANNDAIVYIGGNDYRKAVVSGELFVNNRRKQPITLVIRRRFSGDLLEADNNPTCQFQKNAKWSVNKRNELVWSVTLLPEAEQTLRYKYSVFIAR